MARGPSSRSAPVAADATGAFVVPASVDAAGEPVRPIAERRGEQGGPRQPRDDELLPRRVEQQVLDGIAPQTRAGGSRMPSFAPEHLESRPCRSPRRPSIAIAQGASTRARRRETGCTPASRRARRGSARPRSSGRRGSRRSRPADPRGRRRGSRPRARRDRSPRAAARSGSRAARPRARASRRRSHARARSAGPAGRRARTASCRAVPAQG